MTTLTIHRHQTRRPAVARAVVLPARDGVRAMAAVVTAFTASALVFAAVWAMTGLLPGLGS